MRKVKTKNMKYILCFQIGNEAEGHRGDYIPKVSCRSRKRSKLPNRIYPRRISLSIRIFSPFDLLVTGSFSWNSNTVRRLRHACCRVFFLVLEPKTFLIFHRMRFARNGGSQTAKNEVKGIFKARVWPSPGVRMHKTISPWKWQSCTFSSPEPRILSRLRMTRGSGRLFGNLAKIWLFGPHNAFP